MNVTRHTSLQGFSLVEAVVTLAIISIVSVGLISVANSSADLVLREVTDDSMRSLQQAITGNPVIVLNEARTSFGYLGDMGVLPTDLEDLWIKGSQPVFSFDTTKKTGAGWNGPYLETDIIEMIEGLGIDGWGTDFDFDPTPFSDATFGADALGKLVSYGGNGIDGGEDDISIYFFTSETQSRVQGFIRDEDDNGVSGVGMTVNYPASGSLTSATVQSDSLGFYALTDIPFGNRSLTIEPRLVLAPDTAIVTGNGNDTVELTVKNFASGATTFDELLIEWSISPPAYFDRLIIGNTSVYFDSTPRFAAGDSVTFSDITVDGTGGVAESIPISIQSAVTDVADIVIGDIGRGSSLDITMQDFDDAASGGGGAAVDMTGVIFTLTFLNNSVVDSIVVATPTDPTP